jgi:peptidoglycan/LPS O-acetylase OafA/YrhL
LHDLNQQFDKNPVLSWLATITGIQSILAERVEASFLPAGSTELSENIAQLQTQPASFREPVSLLMGAYNFLFVPTPFVDNGSFFLNAQSYESFVWYLYYLILILLLVGLVRGRYELNLATISSSLFALGFITLSALVEINDGTSVRHRAVLLIGVLVMLATFRSKEASSQGRKDSNF